MALTARKGHAASVRRQSRQRLRSERRYRLPLGIRPYLCPLNFDDHIFRPAAGLEQDGPVRDAGRDDKVRIPAPLLSVDGIVAMQAGNICGLNSMAQCP